MTSATGVYRAALAVGLLLGALTLMAAGNSLVRAPLEGPSLAELSDACGQLLPAPTVVNVAAFVLVSLAATVLLVGARSLGRSLFAQRRAIHACSGAPSVTIGGQDVLVLPDPRPQAFCIGLLRPRIVLSQGTLALLSPRELAAVLAHERHHVDRRDALRTLCLRALADALFFVPLARRLAGGHSSLLEIAADETAARETGTAALARALLAFADHPGPIAISGDRIDALQGRPARADLPLGLTLGALLTAAALIALTLLNAPLAADSDTGGAAATSHGQLCLLVLLAVPAVIAGAVFLHPHLPRAALLTRNRRHPSTRQRRGSRRPASDEVESDGSRASVASIYGRSVE